MTDRAGRIRAYFADCSHADAAAIGMHFTVDAVIYDTNVPPVRGRDAIGRFWVRVREKWGGAEWHVDAVLEDGDRAAIEWTMTGRTPVQAASAEAVGAGAGTGASEVGRAFAVRGAEWYRFEGGLIAEIRQYWTFDPASPGSQLRGFPYAGEDARTGGSE